MNEPLALEARHTKQDCGFDSVCHVWKGACQSRGYASVGTGPGTTALVHRLVYEHHHGELPPGRHVHHRCETKMCIRLDHLAEKEPRAHAQLHSEISVEQVQVIKATHRAQTHKVSEIADQVGVSFSAVENIVKRRRWVDVDADESTVPLDPKMGTGSAKLQRLTVEQVQVIKGRPSSGRGHAAALAREFGVSAVAVSNILNGVTHRDVAPM